jgi:hydroxymethylglutaryl-CoA lyase
MSDQRNPAAGIAPGGTSGTIPAVRVVEVGPRDGLQNEPSAPSTADKIAFIDRLSAAGLQAIEVAAFVSPKWVPQMADSAEVARGIARHPGTRYSALVPNMTGLDRARQAGIADVAVFAAASETFSRRNINQGIDESLAAYTPVVTAARAGGMRVRGYLSTCFGCPYEGPVPPDRVGALAERLLLMGVDEVVLSDTIGVAHPGQVRTVLGIVGARVPLGRVALHLHDTRGTALANVVVALEHGIGTFDASAGGLGGCPYAPGAAGNLATEDLVYVLDGLGVRTGIDLARVVSASRFIEGRLDHPLPSRVYQAERRARQAEERSRGERSM